MSAPRLRRVAPSDVPRLRRDPFDPETLARAAAIVDDVRRRGEAALREHAVRFGDLAPGEPLVRKRRDLESALGMVPRDARELLERTAERVRRFAEAQRGCLRDLALPVPGGEAGHTAVPVERAGCYAPGGRFPLPSSVLMTAVTARAAGVSTVWVASPRPAPIVLAAAAVAGADALLAAGGAHAVAALAFGAGPVPANDAVVGPGNRWVTAAKHLVAGRVAIDLLAGPSELVILADESADPRLVAADLLAQAEHDPDALPVLVTTSPALAERAAAEIDRQIASLPTAPIAAEALAHGFVVLAASMEEAIEACDRIAPEHLELHVRDAVRVAPRLRHYGALFVGDGSPEVLGDYGAGPNHTLPTGGTARSAAGLSVFSFLRVRTWLRVDAPTGARPIADDAVALARLEGLEAHARAAEVRRTVAARHGGREVVGWRGG